MLDQSNLFQNKEILYIISFIFGSVIGSFLNVCIYRLPRDISLVFPPSSCTSCNKPIRFYNNIPILSYIFLRGKCNNCGNKFSIRYPIIELISAILTTLTVYTFGLTFNTLIYLILIYSLIVVTFIDLEHMIIPNLISIPGIVLGLLFNISKTDFELFSRLDLSANFTNILLLTKFPLFDSILGIIFGGGILLVIALVYKKIRKVEGMGMGDVKLLAMIGAFLGLKSVIFVIFISSLIGSIVGITLMFMNKGDLKYAIPYGPFLSLAAILFIFLNQSLLPFFNTF